MFSKTISSRKIINLQFDLITVAQAVHWFNFNKFFRKAKAYLKPQGFIALTGYHLIRIDPGCEKIIDRLYGVIPGKYWDQERKHVENYYRSIPFPFKEIPANH